MRHRKSKIVLNKSKGHTTAVVRNLITQLVKNGRIKTTAKKAKILKQEVEKLISRSKKRENLHAIREANKTFFENAVSKNFFEKYLPTVQEKQSGFVRTFKLGERKGDAAPMVLVELTGAVKMTPEMSTKAPKPKTAKVKSTPETAKPKTAAKPKATAKAADKKPKATSPKSK